MTEIVYLTPKTNCGVVACTEPTTIVETDEKWTVFECALHEARTRHETSPREVPPLQFMDHRAGWKKYGTGQR